MTSRAASSRESLRTGRTVKKESRAFNYLILTPTPATQRWTSSATAAARWLTSPNCVPEAPSRRGLGHDSQPDLVADQHEGNGEVFGTGQEALELGERLVLITCGHPQRERVEEYGVPLLRHFQDFVEVPDLQGAPSGGPAVSVQPHASQQIFVLSNYGRCHVENTLSSECWRPDARPWRSCRCGRRRG